MNVEDNLDSDIFYDFWQLSGYAVTLCRNLGHNSKIITILSRSVSIIVLIHSFKHFLVILNELENGNIVCLRIA